MPQPRVFLTAEWKQLLMLNFAVDPALLRPFLPAGTEIDSFEGRTYVSLVGFQFNDTRVAGFAIPFHRSFEEVNLRFYVRRSESAASSSCASWFQKLRLRPRRGFSTARNTLACPWPTEFT